MVFTPSKFDFTTLNISTAIYLLPVLMVIALGITTLYIPFGPDQASMLAGAISLGEGGVLYQDYWDNKQPGLFWFYGLAGKLFGYTELGVHLLELIWMVLVSTLLVWFLRSVLNITLLAALAPIACVATYYATASEFELAQLEILVSLPILLGIVCLANAEGVHKSSAILWLLSGICAAILSIFKLLLVAIFIGLWSWSLWKDWRLGLEIKQLFTQRVLPAAIGVGLVIGGVVLWFMTQGGFEQFVWTSFVYPPLALQSSPDASYTRILTAISFFIEFTIIWLPFVGYAIYKFVRSPQHKSVGLVIIWLIVSVFLFLIQNFSWWHYHTLLFFVPFGLLGVIGLDALLKNLFGALPNNQLRIAVCLIMLCAASPLFSPFMTRSELLLHHLFVSHQGVHGFKAAISDMYKRQWNSAQFLTQSASLPGPIYVLSNPMVYQYSDREIPHPIVGSSWEFYLPEQIEQIKSVLIEKQVPYIFVGVEDYKVFQLNLSLKMLIVKHYQLLKKDAAGSWYIHKCNLTTDLVAHGSKYTQHSC